MEEQFIEEEQSPEERLQRQRELKLAAQEKRNAEYLNPSEEELKKRRLKKELEEAKLKVQLEKIRQEPTIEQIEKEQKRKEIEILKLEADKLRTEKYIAEQTAPEPGIAEQVYNFRANTKRDDKQLYNIVGYVVILGIGSIFYWLNLESPGGDEIWLRKEGDKVVEQKKKDISYWDWFVGSWEKK